MGKSLTEIAKMAAEWWADKIIDPKMDMGEYTVSALFAMSMAKALVKPVNNETKEVFILNLSQIIEQKLNECQSTILDVDYGPCGELRQAAKQSGISESNFPIKTVMWIDRNRISVRYGYGAKEEYIYSNKEHWKQQIVASKECIERYQKGDYLTWIKDENERATAAAEHIKEINSRINGFEIEMAKAEI